MSTERQMFLVAALIFASIALFFPRLAPILRKRRIKQPHPVMVIVFRVWFALLAVASAVLPFIPRPHR